MSDHGRAGEFERQQTDPGEGRAKENSSGPFALPNPESFGEELARTLSGLQSDIRQQCQVLRQGATGAKLAALQRLSLKRSSQYAGFYKNAIVLRARQVQRGRMDLVKLLQRQAKRLLSPSSASSSSASQQGGGHSVNRVRSEHPGEGLFGNFNSIRSLLDGTLASERPRTDITFSLCPSLPALGMFLREAVLRRGLHERVMAAVLSHNDNDDKSKGGDATSVGNQPTGSSFGSSSAGDDALGEALHILFTCLDTNCCSDNPEDDTDLQVRVPVLLSLEQFLSDAPWCTTHDALTEDERRRRVKADPHGDEDPADRLGFLFSWRDVQRPLASGGDGESTGSRRVTTTATAASLQEKLSTLASASAYLEKEYSVDDGNQYRGALLEDDAAGSTSPLPDALHVHAHAITAEVSRVVDALWTNAEREAAVEQLILALLREEREGSPNRTNDRSQPNAADSAVVDVDGGDDSVADAPSASAPAHGVRQVMSEEEERQLSTIQEFLDVVRVIYSVELSSRLLALNIAGTLLKDSEDFICFDGLRYVPLCVAEGGSAWLSESAATPGNDSRQLDALLPCAVFNLPDTENVFYCIALTVGLALLRDYEAHVRQPLQPNPIAGVHDGNGDNDYREEEAALRLKRLGLATPLLQQQQQRSADWLTAFERELSESEDSANNPLTWTGAAGVGRGNQQQQLLPSFPSALRLWQYLWERVFAPSPSTSVGSDEEKSRHQNPNDAKDGEVTAEEERDDTDENVADAVAFAKHISSPTAAEGGRHDGGGREAVVSIPLSRARARRWLERQVRAAVLRGVAHAKLFSPPFPTPSSWRGGASTGEVAANFCVTLEQVAPVTAEKRQGNGVLQPPSQQQQQPYRQSALLAATAGRIRKETMRLWRPHQQ